MKAVYTLNADTGKVVAEIFDANDNFCGGFTFCDDAGSIIIAGMDAVLTRHMQCTECDATIVRPLVL